MTIERNEIKGKTRIGFDLLVDRLYEFYFRRRKQQYFIYALAFGVSFVYATIAHFVFGRPDVSAVYDAVVLASVIVFSLPFAYILGFIRGSQDVPQESALADTLTDHRVSLLADAYSAGLMTIVHKEKISRTYEVSFIVNPNTTDDELKKLTDQLEQVIADKGGRVTKTHHQGRRKLAYRIGEFDEGNYTFLYLEGSGREIAEVERRLRVNDAVIRYMTVRTDEDLKRAAKMKAKRKGAAAAPRRTDDDLSDLGLSEEEREALEGI